MPRIKIDLPNEMQFETTVKVRISDINYGGHVGNDSILTIFHEARMEYIQSLGFKDELSIAENVGIIVADVGIVYKNESFYGEVLKVAIGTTDFNKYGCDMYYKATNETEVEIARGKTGIVCFNYVEKKLSAMPLAFKELLAQKD